MAATTFIPSTRLDAGDYLTDGRHLYCVVMRGSMHGWPIVLEDCRTLNRSQWSVGSFRSLGLSLVRHAGDEESQDTDR